MTFLDAAYQILKEKRKPIHSNKITEIALKRRLLKTAGKTPEATMNALLILECRKENSRFKKVGPSLFAINPKYKSKEKSREEKREKPISEEFVKRAVIKWLTRNEWGTNLHYSGPREQGIDIKVRHNRYSRYFIIETKGEGEAKSKRSQDEVNFVYGLGQIITRMKTAGARYYYGLALPESSAKIAVRRIPWQVAKKLLLYVFSVSKNEKVKQYSWQDLKKIQVRVY